MKAPHGTALIACLLALAGLISARARTPEFNAGGSTPNDQARFLAGLPVAGGSPLEPLQRAPEYLAHAREYGSLWTKFDEVYFSKMRAFAASVLAPRIGSPQALYYFFSGPDFINAYALFPNVPVYILVSLEPVGSIVPPEQLDAARRHLGLDNLRKSTSMTLQFSFFITKDMKVDLEQTDFKGVLPIMECFIALAGGEISSVAPFSPGGGLPGVCIHFRKGPGAPEQAVYYIEANLANNDLHPALLSWMGHFTPAVSYLKAPSYLPHEADFSRSCDFLLSKSTAILQDDSGIPLRDFYSHGPWQLMFFGKYDAPLDIFKQYHQPDLAAAYQQMGAQPLAFGTGYKWRLGQSNLMLAVKQTAIPRAERVASPTHAPVPAEPEVRVATPVY